MSSIHILPEILSNKIAAGEVVERPASVVKELVENAVDAGSRRIRIELERGGKSLIRVSDDGCGMHRDDALLSIERYATSKIADEKDLFSIRTLGFRGEALPSIASVSRFSLVTRRPEDEVGTRIEIEGGTIKKVVETGAPPGTLIRVRGLFFNTPARRKFLKTVATELSHITEGISAMALAHPQIGFRLLHDGKTLKHWPPVKDGGDRAADVLGADLRRGLLPVLAEDGEIAVSGWLGSPAVSRSTSRGVYAFVNGRWVKDRILQHALFTGYAGRLMKGRYPLAVLFVRIAFDRVDVNVHPTKHEVRFADASAVHGRVAGAVQRALSESDRPFWRPAAGGQSSVREPKERFEQKVSGSRFQVPGSESYEKATGLEGANLRGASKSEPGPWQPEKPTVLPAEAPAARPRQEGLWQQGKFGQLRVVGQYANSYIVCEADRLLILVDQHAAHERILYERLCARSENELPAAQGLLMSETVTLSPREADALAQLIPRLAGEGFDIEPFGGESFVVRAVPALLTGGAVGPLLAEIAERAVADGAASDPAESLDAVRKILACHGAVRAHRSMTEKEMTALLAELDACGDPAHCPHGRPTWIEWPETQIEKQFKR